MTVQADRPPLATGAVSDVRVVAVEAIPVALPLRQPLAFASGTIETADHVLVRIHSDAGLIGSAEAQPRPYTYGESQTTITQVVRDWFAPRLEGADPLALERARMRCAGLAGNHCARGAVEVALADLAGQVLGVPCATLLGGAAETVPVASMLSFGTPAETAEEATRLHEHHGIMTFKAKVGREVALDIASITAVREAVPGALLYVDANRGWTLDQARLAAPALIDLGVSAIEEPLDLADESGRRELASRWTVPLAGDESCRSLAEVARELAGAVTQVSIKVARTAFAESREILAHCRASGVHAVVGSQYEGALGAWASIAFAAGSSVLCGQPAEVGNFLDLAEDLVPPPKIVDGQVAVRPQPGLGVTVDLDAIARHRVDG